MHTAGLEKSTSTVLDIPTGDTGKEKTEKAKVLAHPDWYDAYARRKTADARTYDIRSTQPAKTMRRKINEMSFDHRGTLEICATSSCRTRAGKLSH
jgi:hypothetical protein